VILYSFRIYFDEVAGFGSPIEIYLSPLIKVLEYLIRIITITIITANPAIKPKYQHFPSPHIPPVCVS